MAIISHIYRYLDVYNSCKHKYASFFIFLHGYLYLNAYIYAHKYIYIGAFWLAFGPILHHIELWGLLKDPLQPLEVPIKAFVEYFAKVFKV